MVGEEKVIRVGESGAGLRLDSYLAEQLDLSRSRVAQLIAEGLVEVNGAAPKKRDRSRAGDTIRVRIPEPAPAAATAEPIPLKIVYQDDDLAVIDKPPGLVVHPGPGNRTGTLVNALLYQIRDLSGIGGVLRPGIVHRLDRDTSGLMVVAKNDRAHTRLAAELKKRRIKRRYLAAAWGHLPSDELTVDAPIGRSPKDRTRMAVVEQGRRAVTHFNRLERWRTADLVQVELETGRTHQIRVHLAYIGHPVVGDDTYGQGRARGFSGPDRAWATELARRTPRQFLHAVELTLEHPRTGEEMHFRAPLPEDLAVVADWARTEGPVGRSG